jgi:hypothetical protein
MFPSRSSGGEERDDGRDRSPIPSGELASGPPRLALESPAATSPGPAGWTAARRSCLSLQKAGTRKQAERRAREVPDCATRQGPPVNPQPVRGLGDGGNAARIGWLSVSSPLYLVRRTYLVVAVRLHGGSSRTLLLFHVRGDDARTTVHFPSSTMPGWPGADPPHQEPRREDRDSGARLVRGSGIALQ